MNKYSKKVVSIVLVLVMVMFCMPISVFAATRPSVSISRPSVDSVNIGGTVTYTVSYYNYEQINLSESYISLKGFTANVRVTGSGETRIVTLSNIQGTPGEDKKIAIKTGSAENSFGETLATPNSFRFTLNGTTTPTNPTPTNPTPTNPTPVPSTDRTRPSISIGRPSVSSINVGGTVSYDVTFGDNVGVTGVNLTASTISLNGFTANVSVTGSGNARRVTLSNVQGTAGNKTIALKAGVVSDAAGNSTLATPKSFAFVLNGTTTPIVTPPNPTPVPSVDRVRPSISIGRPSATKIYAGGTVSYDVTFGDNVGVTGINISADYISLKGFTADISVTGTGNTRRITLSNIQGAVGGDKKIALKKGAVEDAAGNQNLATPNSFTFEILANQEGGTTDPETPQSNDTPKTVNKMDDEPYTGVESLPVLPIMGSVAGLLSVAGFVVTKKIYG